MIPEKSGIATTTEKGPERVLNPREETLRLHFVPISPDGSVRIPSSSTEPYKRSPDFIPI
jgi:hypothetical protein